MAFLRLLSNSFEVVGHGIATGATALADTVTNGSVPEVRQAREDQERRLHAAARGVEANAQTVGGDVSRVLGTTGASAAVLATIVADGDQRRRLLELIETYDLGGFLATLTQRRGELPPDFFPVWVRRAGGYFPKLAQVLSVRADLIRDREVLNQFSRCLEDMPLRPAAAVQAHLAGQGWPADVCAGVGEGLNAGTVAQVSELRLPDGRAVVVKVAWANTKRQMSTDFRLFEHARTILGALRLEDAAAQSVAAIFAAVGRSEAAVMREFDLSHEAQALWTAAELLQGPQGPWDRAYDVWLSAAEGAFASAPQPLAMLGTAFAARARATGCRLAVPTPVAECSSEAALAMSRAGGVSMHQLLSGAGGAEARQEAVGALLGSAVPFVGWLLLCRSTSHLAHVDPHPGNFRWDTGSQTLWVLDWGSSIVLERERRLALCLAITLLAESERNDGAVADAARAFGIRSGDEARLAMLMRGMLNASRVHAAQDALNAAAEVDNFLSDVDDTVVPVVRCLATLGGMLKELHGRIQEELQQDIPLSLAVLWRPFAIMGLSE